MEFPASREALTDVAIIGGGPAGSAAAIEARLRGLRVAVWERDHFPRDKVCGEFVSGETLDWLERVIPDVMARAAWMPRAEFVSRRGRRLRFCLPHPARGISRRLLDDSLWQAAALAGARVCDGMLARRVSRVTFPGGIEWQIESASGARLASRTLVLACGRWWTIEGLASPARASGTKGKRKWLGAKAHFQGIPSRDAVEIYFFPGGYCGLAPIEDGLYNACCLVDQRLALAAGRGKIQDFVEFIAAVGRHPALDARLARATQVVETVATAPVELGRRRAEFASALAVGDATGFLDPFTGEGISMAIQSGRLAAEVLGAHLPNAPSSAAADYARRLDGAVRRSHRVAWGLRALVSASAGIQDVAAAGLGWLAERLFVETRWRHGRAPLPGSRI